MGKSKYVLQRPLTAVQQGYFLTLAFPGFKVRTAGNALHCVGVLQPSPTSERYTIEISYSVPSRPRVRVLRPRLRLAPGRIKLPHVFPENDLCLHVTGEWRPDQRISEFIVPWICFWLSFYETWLATGEWLGRGHEPRMGKK